MTKPVIVKKKKTKKKQMLIAINDVTYTKLNNNSTNSIYYTHDAIFSFSERMM